MAFIIDAFVSADDLSFPPNITWKQAVGCGTSNLKEAVLAIGGDTDQWKNLSEEIKTALAKW